MRLWLGLVVVGLGFTPVLGDPPDGIGEKRAPSGVDFYGDPLPEGALARMGTVRFRQHASLKGVCFLADGKSLLVIGAGDRWALTYYDAQSGHVVHSQPGAEFGVSATAATADRSLVAVCGATFHEDAGAYTYDLQVLNAHSGEPVMHVQSDKPFVGRHGQPCLALSPDGATVLMASDNELQFWDISSGADVLRHSFGERQEISCVAFSPDSSTVAIGGRGFAQLWNWVGQTDPRPIELSTSGPRRGNPVAMAFSPDGGQIAVGLDWSRGVALVDVQGGRIVSELNVNGKRLDHARCVEYSPDGRKLAAVGYRSDIAVWDVASGTPIGQYDPQDHTITTMSFSVDGSLLAAASTLDNSLYVFDLTAGTRVLGDWPVHEYGSNFLSFLPGGAQIVSAGDDGTIRFWETDSGRQVKLLWPINDEGAERPTRWIRGGALSPDGTRVASSSLDDTVRLWNTETGQELFRLPGHGRMGGNRALAFSADGTRFASWGDDMRIYVWATATGKALHEYRLEPTGVKLPDEETPDQEDMFFIIGHSTFTPNASQFVLNLGMQHIFEVASGKELARLEVGDNAARNIAVAPNHALLLASRIGPREQIKLADGRVRHSAGKHHMVSLHKLDTGESIRDLVLENGFPGPLTFSVDGILFAVGTWGDDNRIDVFATDSGRLLAHREGLDSRPTQLAFSENRRLLASGHGNGTVLIWDLDYLRKTTAEGAEQTKTPGDEP